MHLVSVGNVPKGEPLIAKEGAKLPELLPVCISFSLALLVLLLLLLLHLRARNANECIKSRLWHLACRDKEGWNEGAAEKEGPSEV